MKIFLGLCRKKLIICACMILMTINCKAFQEDTYRQIFPIAIREALFYFFLIHNYDSVIHTQKENTLNAKDGEYTSTDPKNFSKPPFQFGIHGLPPSYTTVYISNDDTEETALQEKSSGGYLCSICLDLKKNLRYIRTHCGHIFHADCLTTSRIWKLSFPYPCPICRAILADSNTRLIQTQHLSIIELLDKIDQSPPEGSLLFALILDELDQVDHSEVANDNAGLRSVNQLFLYRINTLYQADQLEGLSLPEISVAITHFHHSENESLLHALYHLYAKAVASNTHPSSAVTDDAVIRAIEYCHYLKNKNLNNHDQLESLLSALGQLRLNHASQTTSTLMPHQPDPETLESNITRITATTHRDISTRDRETVLAYIQRITTLLSGSYSDTTNINNTHRAMTLFRRLIPNPTDTENEALRGLMDALDIAMRECMQIFRIHIPPPILLNLIQLQISMNVDPTIIQHNFFQYNQILMNSRIQDLELHRQELEVLIRQMRTLRENTYYGTEASTTYRHLKRFYCDKYNKARWLFFYLSLRVRSPSG
ncbi:hypothetical protein ACH42_16995 [Endozoicomonas sp. (ex Bugula neritina AB1)]|nr:hypothetical protein ACH42_16995 [Endozoicomonas sp. (ex Bugula neritina AB1)]